MNTHRVLLAASTITTALVLTACGTSHTGPLEHGTVRKKEHRAALPPTPIYRYIYRHTNCRNVAANAFTVQLSGGRSTTGGSGGRSTTGGSGSSRVKPAPPRKSSKGSSGSTSGGSKGTRQVCDRKLVRRELQGMQPHPEVWRVLLKKGHRTAWKSVSKGKWAHIKVGDKI
ncbi:hypothetical protein [Streptomyces nigrescens]|uniref:hypothetical protein n=1 Tax=Streptomyces nigrescens TaxID=1920 RepID=UPI0036F802B9